MKHYPVVIIGAGTSGLTAACLLEKYKIPYLLVEQSEQLVAEPRPVLIHKHTLQIYERLGISQEAITSGHIYHKMGLYINGKRTNDFSFSEILPFDEPFDFILSINKDDNDNLLNLRCLGKYGKTLWHTKVVGFHDNGDEIIATLKIDNDKTETITCNYLLAADGAKSKVRDSLGISFSGDMSDDIFIMAEVELKNKDSEREIMSCFSDHGYISLFPIGKHNHYRAVGILPRYIWKDIKINDTTVLEYLQKQTGQPLKFIDYGWQLISRVVGRPIDFCKIGNVFLAGDAAHANSPIIGQGMNIGIQDVYNLCWKLAMVINKLADISILESYNDERSLLKTHKEPVASKDSHKYNDPVQSFFTRKVVPLLVEHLMVDSEIMRKNFTNILSRNKPVYDHSSLSVGAAGNIVAGELMPYLELNIEDGQGKPSKSIIKNGPELKLNFLLITFNLAKLATAEINLLVRQNPLLQLINIPVVEENKKYLAGKGFSESFVAVVRPDFYIGYITDEFKLSDLNKYFLERIKLKVFKPIKHKTVEHGVDASVKKQLN